MLYALLAVMLLLVVGLVVLWPTRGADSVGDTPDAVAHYRKQLADLEEDKDAGLIDESAYGAARLEIERRILSAAKKAERGPAGRALSSSFYYGFGGVVILFTAGLYLLLGNPTAPSAPASRQDALKTPIEEGGPTYGEALEKLKAHVAANPDDQKALTVLARTARAVGDYRLAGNTYATLVSYEPEAAHWRADRFEMFMAAGEGTITPAGKMALDDLTALVPDHPAAAYYSGLYALQQGDSDKAKAIWTALSDRSAADAPWMPQVNARLRELGVKPPKLTDEQINSVNAMSAEERAAFIESMMDRLRGRLEDNPDDPRGWLMLARSELANGDKEAAIATLQAALAVLPEAKKAEIQAFLDNLTGNGNP